MKLENIFYINLEERRDRKEHVENEFKISDNTGYYSLDLLDSRADVRPEIGTIDTEYTMNSTHKDEDCEDCKEENAEMKKEEIELTVSSDVESQW